MGCGGSRGAEVTDSLPDLEGLTGEALQTAMRTHNVKTKWKSHKTPIDMDLLKELGLAGDDDEEPSAGDAKKAESEKAKSAKSAKSGKEQEKVEKTENG